MEKIDSKENFIRIVKQYQNLVFSICLKMTGDYFAAEDLTQDTFISAYHHLSDFDGQSEKAWLCRIAGNKCIDYHKATARRMIPTAEEEMPVQAEGEQNPPLAQVINAEVMEEFERYCGELAEPYRTTALKHFIQGKTAAEIASETDTGLHTVQTHIYRAREKLKRLYRKEVP